MMNKKQEQSIAGEATAIQAGRDVSILYNGLDYNEIKDICMDIFQNNFLQMKAEARQIAQERAAEITEQILNRLVKEDPAVHARIGTPLFQNSLYNVQKEFAISGDRELGHLLVELLIGISKQNNRSNLQLALIPSIQVAAMLNQKHLQILVIVFLLRYISIKIHNLDQLGSFLSNLQIFAENIQTHESFFQHIDFTRAGSISLIGNPLVDIIKHKFGGLFKNGFTKDEIEQKKISIETSSGFFSSSSNNPEKIQINALNEEILQSELAREKATEEDKEKILNLYKNDFMSEEEIVITITQSCPFMKSIFEAWSFSKMKNLELTNVGLIIANAEVRRLTNFSIDLAVWMN